jgi:hypothetical protein
MISLHRTPRSIIKIGMAILLSFPGLMLAGHVSVRADTPFPQTGYSMWGPFEAYWNAHGGLAQFGMPRTSVYSAGKDFDAQWFERALFTFNPSKPDPYKVELNLLGNQITQPRKEEAPFLPAREGSEGTFFAATGHNLSGKFLAYWQQSGGLPIYGYPISEPFMEASKSDGKTYLVQYFERNRFELHPELAGTPHEVELGLLGSELLDMQGGPPSVAGAAKAAFYPPPAIANVPPGGIVQSPNAGTPGPVGGQIPAAPSLSPATGNVLFSSDFSSSDLSAWTPVAPFSPPDATPSAWRAYNGVLEQIGFPDEDGTATEAMLLTNNSAFGDVTLDTYFYPGGGEPGGAVMRYSENGYYVVKLFASAPNSEPKARLSRFGSTGGEIILAQSSSWPGYKPGSWSRITFTAKGSDLMVMVDGVQLLRVSDSHYPSGRVGLYAYADGRAKFDNFRVTTP